MPLKYQVGSNDFYNLLASYLNSETIIINVIVVTALAKQLLGNNFSHVECSHLQNPTTINE